MQPTVLFPYPTLHLNHWNNTNTLYLKYVITLIGNVLVHTHSQPQVTKKMDNYGIKPMTPYVHHSFLILKLSHNPNEGQVHQNKTQDVSDLCVDEFIWDLCNWLSFGNQSILSFTVDSFFFINET